MLPVNISAHRTIHNVYLFEQSFSRVLYWPVAAAKTGLLLNNEEGVIRTFFSKTDIKQLTKYNQYVEQVEKGVEGAQQKLTEFGSSMTSTAQAAAKAANGVALDKLNKSFNWAALGAKALNAAVNFGLSVLLSAAVSWIDAFNHRVERAQQATAVYKNQL